MDDGDAARGADRSVLVVIVSYNTRDLTLDAIGSVLEQRPTPRLIVVDNASSDGSATAIRSHWPDLSLIESKENMGFGRAVNRAASTTTARWMLLLNPDARLKPGALARLVEFAKAHPAHGIYGGRTLFPDGRLNPDSCQGRITPWSQFCLSVGLTRAFRGSRLFNPEGIGGWQRDTAREVDIVHGAFLLIEGSLWEQVGGFDERYWLYGEDADLCLRATALIGKRPLFTPDAVAVHPGGAARDSMLQYRTLIARGRITVMKDHWPAHWRWLVRPLHLVWAGSRAAVESASEVLCPAAKRDLWRSAWRDRADWIEGYSAKPKKC